VGDVQAALSFAGRPKTTRADHACVSNQSWYPPHEGQRMRAGLLRSFLNAVLSVRSSVATLRSETGHRIITIEHMESTYAAPL
jgi:hypothetical protein